MASQPRPLHNTFHFFQICISEPELSSSSSTASREGIASRRPCPYLACGMTEPAHSPPSSPNPLFFPHFLFLSRVPTFSQAQCGPSRDVSTEGLRCPPSRPLETVTPPETSHTPLHPLPTTTYLFRGLPTTCVTSPVIF